MATLTTAQVWKEIENNVFAVLGMVSAKNEARTAGIVYVAQAGKLYITSDKDAWKARHLTANPHVSLTVAIPEKRALDALDQGAGGHEILAGLATLVTPAALDPELRRRLFQVFADDAASWRNRS